MKEGWKSEPLGAVGEFQRGGNFKKSDFIEAGYPCVHYGQIHMTFGVKTERHLSEIPKTVYDKCTKAQKGDLLIAITSEDVEGSCKCTTWLGDYEVALGGHIARFRHKLNPEYVSYFLKSPQFQLAKREYVHGFKVVEIKPSDIAKISIQYPSLEEQAAIVAKIDAEFAKIDQIKSNAKNALGEAKKLFSAELEASVSQKSEWRNVSLGEIATDMYRGSGIKRDQITKEGFPCVRYGEIYTSYQYSFSQCISHTDESAIPARKYFGYGDILFAITGESVADIGKSIAYLGKERGLLGGDIIAMKHKENPQHLAYALSTRDAIRQKGAGKTKLKVVHTNAQALKSIRINLPGLEEQQKIADRLDYIADKIKSSEKNYNQIVAECDALKQAILKKAFE